MGNLYKMIGNAAKPETEKFWRRLRRFITFNSTRIHREGPIVGSASSEARGNPAILFQICI